MKLDPEDRCSLFQGEQGAKAGRVDEVESAEVDRQSRVVCGGCSQGASTQSASAMSSSPASATVRVSSGWESISMWNVSSSDTRPV